jgi:hypothetical protein
MEHRQQPPKDRALDTPGEANRDKHVDFCEGEESTWVSGREDISRSRKKHLAKWKRR